MDCLPFRVDIGSLGVESIWQWLYYVFQYREKLPCLPCPDTLFYLLVTKKSMAKLNTTNQEKVNYYNTE